VIWPNPLRDSGPATIQFTLRDTQSKVSIKIYTTAFRMVWEKDLINVPPGSVQTALPAADKQGNLLANGLYYVLISAPGGHSTGKWLILR
jgi:flagellar hook assembly protein FlgD